MTHYWSIVIMDESDGKNFVDNKSLTRSGTTFIKGIIKIRFSLWVRMIWIGTGRICGLSASCGFGFFRWDENVVFLLFLLNNYVWYMYVVIFIVCHRGRYEFPSLRFTWERWWSGETCKTVIGRSRTLVSSIWWWLASISCHKNRVGNTEIVCCYPNVKGLLTMMPCSIINYFFCFFFYSSFICSR